MINEIIAYRRYPKVKGKPAPWKQGHIVCSECRQEDDNNIVRRSETGRILERNYTKCYECGKTIKVGAVT